MSSIFIDPIEWGQAGHHFRHSMAITCDTKEKRDAFFAKMELEAKCLACSECGQHTKEFMVTHPPSKYGANRETVLYWSYLLHKTANQHAAKRTGIKKDEPSFEVVLKKYNDLVQRSTKTNNCGPACDVDPLEFDRQETKTTTKAADAKSRRIYRGVQPAIQFRSSNAVVKSVPPGGIIRTAIRSQSPRSRSPSQSSPPRSVRHVDADGYEHQLAARVSADEEERYRAYMAQPRKAHRAATRFRPA